MRTNRQILDDLFQANKIDLCRGAIFDQPPADQPPGFRFDKVEGMMLGLAIGDALGVTTEGWPRRHPAAVARQPVVVPSAAEGRHRAPPADRVLARGCPAAGREAIVFGEKGDSRIYWARCIN